MLAHTLYASLSTFHRSKHNQTNENLKSSHAFVVNDNISHLQCNDRHLDYSIKSNLLFTKYVRIRKYARLAHGNSNRQLLQLIFCSLSSTQSRTIRFFAIIHSFIHLFVCFSLLWNEQVCISFINCIVYNMQFILELYALFFMHVYEYVVH